MILIGLIVVFFTLSIYPLIEVVTSSNLVPTIFKILLHLPLIAVIILLEKKGASFAAHFMLFFIYLSDAFYTVLNDVPLFSAVAKIYYILGFIASFYVILKLFAHKEELSKYFNKIDRPILVLIIISLMDVYFTEKFPIMIVYLLIFGLIASSLRAKETLLLVLAIFIGNILTNCYQLYTLLYSGSTLDIIRAIIWLGINIAFTVYAYRLYNTKDPFVDERIQYYS